MKQDDGAPRQRMERLFLCASRLKISSCFSSFPDFFSPSAAAAAQFSPGRPADRVRAFDPMSSVWRIKSEAFGVAGVSWRCGVAALGRFDAASPKPDNCIVFLCVVSSQIGSKLLLTWKSASLVIIIFLYTFFRFPGPNSFDSVQTVPPGWCLT